uniref:MOB kinase activator 1B n=1 Tax=Oncorhynchus tshawytscha TaxID=74940 RepID=A0AAZ3SC00_ONCTS
MSANTLDLRSNTNFYFLLYECCLEDINALDLSSHAPQNATYPCYFFTSTAVDFFNQINMLYGTITDFCTEESCPVMSAGPKYEYHWADGTNIKKPIKCSAPKYIDYLMTWVQDQLDDETLFPSKIGVPFRRNFMSVAKTILKRLFRVYAHIYHQHFDSVMQLQEEAHLNTSFKHFIFFVQEFNLIDRKELVPLQELIDKLTTKDR